VPTPIWPPVVKEKRNRGGRSSFLIELEITSESGVAEQDAGKNAQNDRAPQSFMLGSD